MTRTQPDDCMINGVFTRPGGEDVGKSETHELAPFLV